MSELSPLQRLEQSEARYRSLFEFAQVGIVLADADSVYIDANASACRMFGYTREEFIGLHATDIVVQAEVVHVQEALDTLHGHADHFREWQFRRKDGSVFPADVIATKLPDGTLLGTILDISDRKQLNEYRQHMAAIVESSVDAIFACNLRGEITTWNIGAQTIFGWTAAEMLGSAEPSMLPADKHDEALTLLAELKQGRHVALDTTRLTRDGRIIDVFLTAAPLKDSAGELLGFSVIARDISVLKQHEREIERLSRLYAALSQINQAIVWSTNRNALFQKVCEVLVEFGGFGLAWIGWQDKAAGQLVPVGLCGDKHGLVRTINLDEQDRPDNRGPSITALVTGQPYVCNNLYTAPALQRWRAALEQLSMGSVAAFPIRANRVVVGMLSVYAEPIDFFHDKEVALLAEAATDVSFGIDNFLREDARREVEQTLRNEKQFSDTMIESMPGVLYFFDSDGRFIRWNKNFEQVSGYTHEQVAGMHPLDFFKEPDKALVAARIGEVFTLGQSSVEAPFLIKDGSTLPYFFTGRRVMFDGKMCLVGVGVDISERQRRHVAEEADRLKSAFLATMSHELRTPLNSILGFTGILLQGLSGPLNAEQTKHLGTVRSSARHLLELINDVLDISKIEAGQLEVRDEPVDLVELLSHVNGVMQPLALKKGLALTVAIPAQPLQMHSDRRRIEQILLNLLNNAIKFTDRGHVELNLVLTTLTIAGTMREAVQLRVTDTGIGIKPENMPLLFQPFRQVDMGLARQHEGTGLGLSICRRLAELLGGEISATSQWQQGSEFTLTLPLQKP